MDNFEINIYVANLSKYNGGEIYGEWIELPTSNLDEELQEILCDDEEWIILDAECDFLDIGEYENIYKLNDLAFTLENLKNYEKRALKSILEAESDIESALDILKNEEYIIYDDVTDDDGLGQYLIENAYFNVPEELEMYIDTEALGRDYAINHNIIYTKRNTAIEIF